MCDIGGSRIDDSAKKSTRTTCGAENRQRKSTAHERKLCSPLRRPERICVLIWGSLSFARVGRCAHYIKVSAHRGSLPSQLSPMAPPGSNARIWVYESNATIRFWTNRSDAANRAVRAIWLRERTRRVRQPGRREFSIGCAHFHFLRQQHQLFSG